MKGSEPACLCEQFGFLPCFSIEAIDRQMSVQIKRPVAENPKKSSRIKAVGVRAEPPLRPSALPLPVPALKVTRALCSGEKASVHSIHVHFL